MGYSVREQTWWVVVVVGMTILGLHVGGGEGCLREEREALLKLKEAFNYPNGSSLPSWNNLTNHSDCCTWERVACDNYTHRVIELDLSHTRPQELRRIKWSLNASYFLPFHQLQHLDLWANYLSQSDLSRSRNLKVLSLLGNFLEGSLPESIMSLTSLTFLSLSHNNMNGSLPKQGGLCNMKNLQQLDLSLNNFEGKLPMCLGNLTSLSLLALNSNGFEGIFPSWLFHTLRSLATISFSDDNFRGSFSLSLLANHSNLRDFHMSCYNTNVKLETENPSFFPSFQLSYLYINGCTLNEVNNNKMPTFLLYQQDLLVLELTHLNISGAFPSWLLTNNTKLNTFAMSNNLLIGPFEPNSTSKLLQMQFFDVSSNPIKHEVPSNIGSIFPNLISLNMSSCSLQGIFPASIGEMRQLNDLDLSDNNLSSYLPQEFGRGGSELRFMRLSNNNLSSPCFPVKSTFRYLLFVGLNNNNFKGNIPTGIINSTGLRMLDLNANQLSGEIPSWIGNFQRMSYLILSKNSLRGSVPQSFCNLTELIYLELSENKFKGSLPSCLNMPLLKYLHLQSNQFMRPLPSTLANSPLLTLDLMRNNFSGQVPILFSLFLNLRVLILKENKLKVPFLLICVSSGK
ncbi:receptor-like protein 8 isoform X2 [Prosopis cineraria]|uniref:receptor-like protein 8 isoform X2 n=1 Tax=Prosopis cineraria TaxID=364024 RepID=UPI002410A210|nr:receptor-like protein 8 isoform X2 [Prosopis cineraria]